MSVSICRHEHHTDAREIRPEAGEHIQEAIRRLVKHAPAFMVFNDTCVEARKGDKPEQLLRWWNTAREKEQIAYEKSDEYRTDTVRRLAQISEATKTLSQGLLHMSRLDFKDLGAVLAWMASVADATNLRGVEKEQVAKCILHAFARRGLVPGMNTGDAFDRTDRENFAKWVIGQALEFLKEPPHAVHDCWARFYKEWVETFGERMTEDRRLRCEHHQLLTATCFMCGRVG